MLNKSDQNYRAMRKELVALFSLSRKKFVVGNDLLSLQCLRDFEDPEVQVARWQEILQEYDFECVLNASSSSFSVKQQDNPQ